MQAPASFSSAIGTKYPEQVAIVIARDDDGICNPITVGWIMNTSHAPPMLAFSVGKTRYSLDVIRRTEEFVIAFPSEAQGSETLYFGTVSGRDENKLAASKIKTQPAEKINCVLLSDAAANFECTLSGELETGDHVIFAGEAVQSHRNKENLHRLYTIGKGHTMGGVRPAAPYEV